MKVFAHSLSRNRSSSIALALLLAMGSGNAAFAQVAGQETGPLPDADEYDEPVGAGGIAPIIVTAQRRAENVQDVPIAVSAVSSEALENSGIDSSDGITQLVPSVQFTRSGASGLFFVRGVGTTNAAVGEEGSNAFYVDGVYIPDLSGTITQFNSIERIEVLKGPQGTLFGRNATGGLVHVITREPGDERVLKGEIGYGNYNTVSAKVYAAQPITDTLSTDIALFGKSQMDGWGRNFTRDEDIRLGEFYGARSKTVFRPSDDAKFTFIADYGESEDNLAVGWRIADGFVGTGGFESPGGQDSTADGRAITELDTWGFSLQGEFDLDFATLTSISAVRDSENSSDFDADGGPLNLLRIAFDSGTRSYQQELRLASNDTDPFSWQVGAFYLNAKSFNDSTFSGLAFALATPPGAGQEIDASLKTDSIALFGEGSYAITPSTQVTAGVRFTKEKRSIDGTQTILLTAGDVVNPVDDTLKYDEWSYRLALRQDITDDINVYASINRSFKAGTFSLQAPTNAPADPQFITAYEVGVKSELLDRRLRLNAAYFHYDIDDYQVRSAAVATPGSSVLLNAATVKVDGVDVEFEFVPTDNWSLFGGFTWLDSRFDKFGGPGEPFQAPFVYPNPAICNATGTSDPGTTTGPATGGLRTCLGDASGKTTPLAPDFAASLGTTYTLPLGDVQELRFTALYSYNSGFPFEPDGRLKQDEFHVVNGSVEWRLNEHLGVELWGKNIFDEEYAVQKLSQGTGAIESFAPPRTYGGTLKFDF